MKIAVGGSAANPPHLGHKKLVEAIISTGEFVQVHWIVSGDRPDKPGLMEAKIRYEMGKLLLKNTKEVIISYEKQEAIPTVYVLEKLQRQYSKARIVWYCGADHFVRREKFGGDCDILGFWDKGKFLFENQDFLIIPRVGLDMNNLQLPVNYQILSVQIPKISSTNIRCRLKQKKSVAKFVGADVRKYIKKNKLYLQEA